MPRPGYAGLGKERRAKIPAGQPYAAVPNPEVTTEFAPDCATEPSSPMVTANKPPCARLPPPHRSESDPPAPDHRPAPLHEHHIAPAPARRRKRCSCEQPHLRRPTRPSNESPPRGKSPASCPAVAICAHSAPTPGGRACCGRCGDEIGSSSGLKLLSGQIRAHSPNA